MMKLLYFLLSYITLAAGSPILPWLEPRDLDCSTATYKEIILTGINTHRANHSVDDLVWNKTLAAAAKKTSINGVYGVHDNSGTGWGQNLYGGWGSDDSGEYGSPGHAISSWYVELRNYDTYGADALVNLSSGVISPPPATPGAVYGHFTQLVWKNTATVGCHTAPRLVPDNPGNYTVCNFYPPGNYVTEDDSWEINVLPPLGDDPVGPVC